MSKSKLPDISDLVHVLRLGEEWSGPQFFGHRPFPINPNLHGAILEMIKHKYATAGVTAKTCDHPGDLRSELPYDKKMEVGYRCGYCHTEVIQEQAD